MPTDTTRANLEAIFLPAVRRDAQPGLLRAKGHMLDAAFEPAPPPRFSPFIPEDLRAAAALATELGVIADAAPTRDEGVGAASARARDAAEANPGLARHAFGLFATHHPRGRGAPIPTLLERLALAATLDTDEALETTLGSGATGEEAALDWYREDPLANEHHEHWHWVYPNTEIDDPNRDPRNVRRRHGELFYYMHQQMLARYDVERVALGLPPVAAMTDYRAGLGAGYDPGKLRTLSRFGRRPADAVMLDFVTQDGSLTVDSLVAVGANLREGAAARRLGPDDDPLLLDGHAGSSHLGDESEPTPNARYGHLYGNHHGGGHVCIMAASQQDDGVIGFTDTAIRDPAFWRWHRHVDDIHFSYQDQLAPHDFADAPAVSLAGLSALFEPADWDALDAEARGQAAETSLANPGPLEWRTTMRKGVFRLMNDQGSFSYSYLTHAPFLVTVALDNPGEKSLPVTLRLFLLSDDLMPADRDLATDRQARRFVIELDKVKLDAAPGRSVHARPGRQMSVIRRPAVVDPAEVVDLSASNRDTTECTCGWPFGLLLPRGTAAGMRFTLFAMLTDNVADRVVPAKACGSMSFCGAGDEYPDARPMGYPFDRRLEGTVADLVAAHPGMATRPVTIRWTNPEFRADG